jgi:hypothetical protein
LRSTMNAECLYYLHNELARLSWDRRDILLGAEIALLQKLSLP